MGLGRITSGKKKCDVNGNLQSRVYGSVERHKARLVAKGFTQTYDVDYTETFAQVAKLNTVHILLSLAANIGWPLHQPDITIVS